MKILGILLLMIFSGCNGVKIDGRYQRCILSIKYNKCRCALYDFEYVERLEESIDAPMDYCENGIVIPIDAWASFKKDLIEIREARLDAGDLKD